MLNIPSTQERGGERIMSLRPACIHSKFQDSLNYTVRPYLKHKIQGLGMVAHAVISTTQEAEMGRTVVQ
jgi:hypothetical protein